MANNGNGATSHDVRWIPDDEDLAYQTVNTIHHPHRYDAPAAILDNANTTTIDLQLQLLASGGVLILFLLIAIALAWWRYSPAIARLARRPNIGRQPSFSPATKSLLASLNKNRNTAPIFQSPIMEPMQGPQHHHHEHDHHHHPTSHQSNNHLSHQHQRHNSTLHEE